MLDAHHCFTRIIDYICNAINGYYSLQFGPEVEPSRRNKSENGQTTHHVLMNIQVGRWANQIYEDPSWVTIPILRLEKVTHSQLLEGLKCESQTKNNERVRSRSMLLGSQHFRGVEGRAGAPGWDQEELTSFTHSHGPAQNQRKVVSAQLEHLWCQDEPRATRTHKTHHGPDLGEATTFPLIVYSTPLHMAHIQMVFLSQDSQVGILKLPRLGLL